MLEMATSFEARLAPDLLDLPILPCIERSGRNPVKRSRPPQR